MTELDDVSDRNLAAALWATHQEEQFGEFGSLPEFVQAYWIGHAERFRALMATITKPATVLAFPSRETP